MAFDLDSAVPVGGGANTPAAPQADNVFDLSSARPIGEAQATQQAQAIAVANSGQSADAAGRAASVGRQIGAPQSAVETDLPRFEAQAKAQQNAATLAANPKLADWVAKNPDSARVAQDDFDGMANIDQIVSGQVWGGVKQIAKGLAQGAISSALGLNRAIAAGIANQTGYQYSEKSPSALSSPITGQQAQASSDWWYQNMVAPQIQNRAEFKTPDDAPFGVKAANSAGQMLYTLLEIAATGGASAEKKVAEVPSALKAIGEQFTHGARAMAFPALTASVNTGQDVYNQTGDMSQAIRAAQMSYATTTLGGVVPIGAEGGLATRLASGFVSGAASGELNRQAMNLVMPQQEGFDPEQTILSGLSGAMLSGALGRNPLHDAVRQAYSDGIDAETAERGAAKIQQIAEAAASSKLRTHDPDAFRNYVASVAENGDFTEVYVDGNKFADALHQSEVDPANIPGLNERLNEAVQTGGDVQIPIEDYATHIAGTDLDKAIQPELKAEEGGMTYAEGQKFFENAKEEMAARAQDLVSQQAEPANADIQKISDTLFDQIKATGRYPDDVARASLTPVTEFYRTMAERTGMTPGELYEQFPLRIVGHDAGGLRQSELSAESVNLSKADSSIFGDSLPREWLGNESVPLESHVNGAAGNAENVSDLSKGNAALPEENRFLSDPAFSAVLAHVRAAALVDPKVLDSIVRSVPVDVVNNLFGSKAAAKKALHNEPMFKDSDALNADLSISKGVDASSPVRLLVFEAARLAAKRSSRALNSGLEAKEGSAAVGTNDRNSFSQENPRGSERGAFQPSTNTISLLRDADLTSFLHESGHFFLSTLGDLAGRENAPQQIKDDMQTFLTWAGGKDLADWQGKTLEEQRDHHEKFAQGFERYLMEGRAPTTEMQPLFQRFRSWLVNVYRSITGLGAELTPEVRGVFDRLVASDDAIQRAEMIRAYGPLDLSKSGLTEKQQADYTALGEKATQDAVDEMQQRSLRDMKWASNAKSRALKRLQRESSAQRDLIREEVTREFDDSPVEKARNFIAANDLKAKDPGTLDLVAEQFGIGSGAELAEGLAQTKADRAAQIDQIVDQRMLERHGELVDPQAVEDAANEAVHNEARARFMATGLKLLAKLPVPARELAKAAEEAANTAIAGKRVRDLNPRQYEVTETKANREAIDKAPKDPAAAVQAQRQALLSNRLAKAAREAAADVQKIVKAQAKYDKDSIRKKMDPDILEQIDALRDRFDFRQKPPAGPEKKEVQLQQWVDTQKAFGYAPVQHPGMMDPTVRMHYKDMTVEQIRGFNETIRSMEQIARERKSITIEGKKVDLAEAVGGLVDKMKERGEQFSLKDIVDRPRAGTDPFFRVALDRMGSFIQSSIAEAKPQQFKANQFDTHEILGPFTRAIFDRVFNANYAKIDMLKSLAKDFRAGADELGKDWQKSLSELVPNTKLIDADLTQETGETVYRRLTRGDMLGIARHVGNESNFDKLVKGMGWEPRDVWSFLNEHMTDKDWKATQLTWDAFEKHWPEMVEMNRRLGNVSPDRIEPRPFRTPNGIDMKGGYAPIDYDPVRSKLAVRKSDASAINPSEGLFGKGYFRADTTTNGSLNSRVANYYDRLDLDFHSIERRLHDTIHDLAYREALLDVHKVLSDADFRRQFQLTYGPEQYKSLQEWVGDLANGQNADAQQSKLSQILQSTRHMVVANGIALRVSTMIKHGGSAAFKSAGYFSGPGAKYFAARAAKIATDHVGQIEGAIEKFSEIRARSMQQDRDYRETTASLFQPEGFQSKAERFGHSMVAYLDLMSAVPTAWGAYDRAITEGIPKNRGGTGVPMSEEDAVAYANQVVREAHGSNIESARSMLLQNKSEVVKMFTMMYGFMNNSLGQSLDMADKLRTSGFSKPEVLARFMGSIIVPALAAGLVEHHKKDEGWGEWAAKAITGEVAGMVPLVRDAWNAVRGYPSAGMAPLMQTLSYGAKPFKDAWDAAHGKTIKAPIKDLGNAIGLAIPGAGQVGTTLQYAADWKAGKQQPKNVADVARGLALGQGNK